MPRLIRAFWMAAIDGAMSSAPLVDIALTSTPEELKAIAVIMPMGDSAGSNAMGVTIGLITPRVPVVEAKAETSPGAGLLRSLP